LTLRDILDEVKRELTEKERTREVAHEDMRKATNFSKQSILAIIKKSRKKQKN